MDRLEFLRPRFAKARDFRSRILGESFEIADNLGLRTSDAIRGKGE